MKRIVHQIFWSFKENQTIEDIPVFLQNTTWTQAVCNQDNIEYKLWNKEDCDNLIKSDFYIYSQLWDDFFEPIQQVDFIRYCILYKYGGIYLDCDIKPVKPFDELFDKEFFFVHWNNDKKRLPYNAIMGSKEKNELFKSIMLECEKSFYEKRNIEIYGEWRGRFVFQTTGHFMLERVMKTEKIDKDKYFLNILKINNKGKIITGDNVLFEDDNLSTWY